MSHGPRCVPYLGIASAVPDRWPASIGKSYGTISPMVLQRQFLGLFPLLRVPFYFFPMSLDTNDSFPLSYVSTASCRRTTGVPRAIFLRPAKSLFSRRRVQFSVGTKLTVIR